MKEEKQIKTTVVAPSVYEAIDFIPPAAYYIRTAYEGHIYIHTSNIEEAQKWIDNHEIYGGEPRRYTPIPSKSRRSSKEVNVRGTQTRRGQKRY